jgi:hypothetical protein
MIARKTRFFEHAHATPRRDIAPVIQHYLTKNLGARAKRFGRAFEQKVKVLFGKGHSDISIARLLNVGRTAVYFRTRQWRKSKRKR